MTGRYHAPFAEHGSHTVDADIADRLLRIALAKGGDYADLFFEFSVSGSYAYDEQILKSATRDVSCDDREGDRADGTRTLTCVPTARHARVALRHAREPRAVRAAHAHARRRMGPRLSLRLPR